MSKTAAEYEHDYQSTLTQIRSLLAAKRSAANLAECQRLLGMARAAATALQALAEVDGDYVTIQQAQARLDRELTPLQLEISRGSSAADRSNDDDDLFYRPTDLEQQGMLDTEALMASSHALLRESQALVSETEYIGMNTLVQMGQQREQLQIASDHLDGTSDAMFQARILLTRMRDKVWRNKVALQIVACGLVLLNLGVLVLIYKKHKR